MEESLELARQSLALLRAPWVARHRPMEGSVLLSTNHAALDLTLISYINRVKDIAVAHRFTRFWNVASS